MMTVNPTYAEAVTAEQMQEVYGLAKATAGLPIEVMYLATVCGKMAEANPDFARKLQQAQTAAEEAAKALAVLNMYLEVVKHELA